MKYSILLLIALLILSISPLSAQISSAVAIDILKAEDARRYDSVLENLLSAKGDERVTVRALLAAGRIGDRSSSTKVAEWLTKGSPKVREMAAFALGELESITASDVILTVLKDLQTADSVRARAVEAAGKIAAANTKEEKAKDLGAAIIDVLETENRKAAKQSRPVILLALTAALRARPTETAFVAAKFLTNLDPRVRADAANTLARVRAKNANDSLRSILLTDNDAISRASAARALGAAEDKDAVDILLEAATSDDDSRVRVSSIRSLAAIKDPKAADRLLDRGEILLAAYKRSKFSNPIERNELLEIAISSGVLLKNTGNERAFAFLGSIAALDNGRSPEIYLARFRIKPGQVGIGAGSLNGSRQFIVLAQLMGEFASIEPTTDELKRMKAEALDLSRELANTYCSGKTIDEKDSILAASDAIRAFAKFKTTDLPETLRMCLNNKDIFIRATAAELLADLPTSKENVEVLKTAFSLAVDNDKDYNDAQLAVLAALFKLDKKESVGSLLAALNAPDYLVRRTAFALLEDKDLQRDFPDIPSSLKNSRKSFKDRVLPYSPALGTKLGQLLNTDADYHRALSRKNGSVKAVLSTEKGLFTIDLLPEDAPLTVDNFIKLAKSNYFDGLEVHRVVPNFVMQDGDPRGDGNGGPGWSIRCEMNMVPYERGAVGMALSGKDTGGSQWFVTHSPQPHLDGGYSIFGRVNETGMKIVDDIVRGDKIISVKVIERSSPSKKQNTRGNKKR
ncbi:MAG: peptidylprolyl isomerase [Pyrinomonadaceae bacterium]